MPSLAVELDGKKKFAPCARAAGVEVGVIAWGLLELWEHVWVTRKDHVSRVIIDGCFGRSDRTIDALIAYGFLEAVDREYRVKGAARYLRVAQGNSAGGHMQKGNLRQYRKGSKSKELKPESRTGSPPAPLRLPSGSPSGSTPADHRSPITDHRSPITEKEKASAPSGRPRGDPRHAPVKARLLEVFKQERGAEYPRWTGREGKDLQNLLALFPADDELVATWRQALRHRGYPTVSRLGEFYEQAPHFVGRGAAVIRLPTSGAATAADKDWSGKNYPTTPDGQIDIAKLLEGGGG